MHRLNLNLQADNYYYNDVILEVLDICDSGCSDTFIKGLEKLVNFAKDPIQGWKKIDSKYRCQFLQIFLRPQFYAKFHFKLLISIKLSTFSDIFNLEIPFDGSNEMNIGQMLFDILYRMGYMVQFAYHGSKEMDEGINRFCSGFKLYTAMGKSETAMGEFYKA